MFAYTRRFALGVRVIFMRMMVVGVLVPVPVGEWATTLVAGPAVVT